MWHIINILINNLPYGGGSGVLPRVKHFSKSQFPEFLKKEEWGAFKVFSCLFRDPRVLKRENGFLERYNVSSPHLDLNTSSPFHHKKKQSDSSKVSSRTQTYSHHWKPLGTWWQTSPVSCQACQNPWPHNEPKTRPDNLSSRIFSNHGQRSSPNPWPILIKPYHTRLHQSPQPPKLWPALAAFFYPMESPQKNMQLWTIFH